MPIATGKEAATIYYDASEAAVVGITAKALSEDVMRVTGIQPVVSTGTATKSPGAVFVGTLGKSKLIDQLAAQGKLDVSAILGQWEMYTVAVISDPVPGVAQGLIIAGSDRRGTAFGIFGLSEAMGVSPWYWWADVVPTTKAALYVAPGIYTATSPGVKYRGIFLNDEDWGLQPWAAKTFDPKTGDIGPATYAKVFELLLRLHANFCWPAMHDVTKAFDTFPQNKVVADDYAIVMGSSHHEPMLRDTSEYNAKVLGPYSYFINRNNIYHFWDERVAENRRYENIYTIGMRGQTDDGMLAPPGTTTKAKAKELQDFVIPDQRQMLTQHVNSNAAVVPQIFVPYKEALLQYQAGLQVPDDVTLVWPDDNHGYIRELSTTAEQARSGGSGIYYHLSYWGLPKDYLWLCTTPPAMTWEEMSKAWDYHARRLWIVNIGDLKPGEIGMDFFLRLARDPEAFRGFSQHNFLNSWAARTFGQDHAEAIASLLDEYYRLNIIVRPEHLNLVSSGFSLISNGDEAQRRLDDFATLVTKANLLVTQVPAFLKDAYYQLVLYPVRASALMNQKVLMAERSRLYAEQGRAATAETATQASAAFDAVQSETRKYNADIADGKWNRMMSCAPHPQPGDVFTMPATGTYHAPAQAGLGVAVEGRSEPLGTGSMGTLPSFEPMNKRARFIDVFNTGSELLKWTATEHEPWIVLSQTSGEGDARLLVNVDWTSVPRGNSVGGRVTVQGAGATRVINVTACYPASYDPGKFTGAVEDNGSITIEAKDFNTSHPGKDGAAWRKVERAAASHDGVTIFPTTAASIDPAAVASNAPALVYQFYTFGTGPATVQTDCLPTHHINSEHPGVRYAIAINDEVPQIVDVDADEYSKAWNANVLRASAHGFSKHEIKTPGQQILRVWMVDTGVVLDRFNVRVGYQPGGEFEAEALPVAAKSGQTYRSFVEVTASGGSAVALEASQPGDYVTYRLSEMQAGDYSVSLRAKEMENRGEVQVSYADSVNGEYTDAGGKLDLYNANPTYAELKAGLLNFKTPGTKYLRFQVIGRNPANKSNQSWIVLDRLTLDKVPRA